MFNSSRFSSGFLLGFGAGFVSRDLMSANNSMMRPLVKGVIRAGYTLVEKGRESVAHMFETVEDLIAEVRTEKSAAPSEPVVTQTKTHHVKVNVSKSS